jgi:uncharacterized membrane protein YbaN (DUF454 family)
MAIEKERFGESTIKLIYNIFGTIFLLLALIGITLPVVPTTPFVLLSAACYYKGSKTLHSWLSQSKIFGQMIIDYEEHKGMKKSTKVRALTIMWTMVLASAFLIINSVRMQALVFLIAIIGTIVMLKIPTI